MAALAFPAFSLVFRSGMLGAKREREKREGDRGKWEEEEEVKAARAARDAWACTYVYAVLAVCTYACTFLGGKEQEREI